MSDHLGSRHINYHEFFGEDPFGADDGYDGCMHSGIVSISATECQCMDCLRKWEKSDDFKSDFPEFDRG